MRNHEVNIDKFKFEGTKLKYIYIYKISHVFS
jgi:hypothetical protein